MTHRWMSYAVIMLVCLLSSTTSAKLILDDFESGPYSQSIDSSTSSLRIEQDGLPVIGGTRQVVLSTFGISGIEVSAELTLSPQDDEFVIEGLLPASGIAAAGVFTLNYGSQVNRNSVLDPDFHLNARDFGDRFLIRLTDDPGNFGILSLSLNSGGQLGTFNGSIGALDGSGHYEVLFDDLETLSSFLDVTDLNGIALDVSIKKGINGRIISVTEFSIVPEPAVLGIMAIAAVVLRGRCSGRPGPTSPTSQSPSYSA